MDRSLKRLVLALPAAVARSVFALSMCAVSVASAASANPSAGERIYREGMLPSGSPLIGRRESAAQTAGAAAACVNCHGRSGLGAGEGSISVPPIIGRYLFASTADAAHDPRTPHLPSALRPRPAYTEASLGEAIRNGVAVDDRPLNYLMPRYELSDDELAELTAYLRQLAARPPPGVEPDTLHFATIVTPEADPEERDAMLDVLAHFFAEHNSTLATSPRSTTSEERDFYRVQRRWQLSVYRLSGAARGWPAQLREYFQADPVLAVVSGAGGRHWLPIHEFCEAVRVPCVLPNVLAPVVAANDFYPIYFSRGVFLEADLIAHEILKAGPNRSMRPGASPNVNAPSSSHAARVVEIYRANSVGEDGADALRKRLDHGVSGVLLQAIDGPDRRARLANRLAAVRADDVLVLWLPAADLAMLPARPPVRSVFVSGLQGGLENAPLPAAWRATVSMTYPLELPDQRRSKMAYTRGWLRQQHIPVNFERIQADTYLASQVLGDALDGMVDSYIPDYLVERIEAMMSTRLINGSYPRLGLGTNQRFASKGGYLVRFAAPIGPAIRAEGDWFVP